MGGCAKRPARDVSGESWRVKLPRMSAQIFFEKGRTGRSADGLCRARARFVRTRERFLHQWRDLVGGGQRTFTSIGGSLSLEVASHDPRQRLHRARVTARAPLAFAY